MGPHQASRGGGSLTRGGGGWILGGKKFRTGERRKKAWSKYIQVLFRKRQCVQGPWVWESDLQESGGSGLRAGGGLETPQKKTPKKNKTHPQTNQKNKTEEKRVPWGRECNKDGGKKKQTHGGTKKNLIEIR